MSLVFRVATLIRMALVASRVQMALLVQMSQVILFGVLVKPLGTVLAPVVQMAPVVAPFGCHRGGTDGGRDDHR